MNKKQKKMLTRIIIAAVLMIAFKVISTFVDIPTGVLFIMYMVPYLVIGYDILRKAIKGILNRQVFDENFLMAVAILYDFAGGNIRVRKLENGHCVASFQKMDSVTLVGWFMQHAGMYKVVGPEKLRNEVQERIQSAWKVYSR